MKHHPAADLFPMMDQRELDALVDSMRRHGYDRTKPIVTLDGLVLDGRNRLKAASMANVVPCFVEAPTGCNPWRESWKHNGARRDLEADHKTAVFLKILAQSDAWEAERERTREEANKARAEAAKAQIAAQPRDELGRVQSPGRVSRDTRPGPVTPPPWPERDIKTNKSPDVCIKSNYERTKIAEAVGVSPATVARVQALQAKSPERFEAVARGEQKANKALAEIKLEAKHELAEKLNAAPLPAPDGPYRVIVIDPPWRYDSRAEDVTHRGRSPYPDMTTDQICALPVADLAEDDCILWLWTTNAFMRDAFACLDAWGFKQKTILTWLKDRMGTGDWLRGKTEHCLMAVRGKPIVTLTNQTTVLQAPVREHSRKPDEFFDMVDVLCPGSKLEMFSREAREGWAAWGAEVEKFNA